MKYLNKLHERLNRKADEARREMKDARAHRMAHPYDHEASDEEYFATEAYHDALDELHSFEATHEKEIEQMKKEESEIANA